MVTQNIFQLPTRPFRLWLSPLPHPHLADCEAVVSVTVGIVLGYYIHVSSGLSRLPQLLDRMTGCGWETGVGRWELGKSKTSVHFVNSVKKRRGVWCLP
jgi:hypothetical protein